MEVGMKTAEIPNAEIEADECKFVLIELGDRTVLYATDEWSTHEYVFYEFCRKHELEAECTGGGFVHMDSNSQTIRVGGGSRKYGWPDYDKVESLLIESYPGWAIELDLYGEFSE
jgi:hypothetical protein